MRKAPQETSLPHSYTVPWPHCYHDQNNNPAYTCDFSSNLSIISSYGIVFSTSIFKARIIILDNHSSSMVVHDEFFMIRFLLKALSAKQLLMANDTSILKKIVGWLNVDSWVNSLKGFPPLFRCRPDEAILGKGGAVSVGPIWHACIAVYPSKHRNILKGFENQTQWAHISIFVTYAPTYIFVGDLILDNFYSKHFIHILDVFDGIQL